LAKASEINAALAKLAEDKLTEGEIDEAFSEASDPTLSPARINKLLVADAKKSLRDITKRKYHKILENEAQEIIDLGMAIHYHGAEIKAIFKLGLPSHSRAVTVKAVFGPSESENDGQAVGLNPSRALGSVKRVSSLER
jgi:hypothetical protein